MGEVSVLRVLAMRRVILDIDDHCVFQVDAVVVFLLTLGDRAVEG